MPMIIGAGTNVLVVDNFATARRFILMCLTDLGIHKCAEAESVDQAYAMMQKERFDLVLLDWNMPQKNGFALLKQMRTKTLRTIPVILMLMEKLDEYIAQGNKLGMSAFIIKPFDSTTLSRILLAI